MNKNAVNKLSLMLLALTEKYKQNREFFIGIDFTFGSGDKLYKGEIAEQGQGFFVSFFSRLNFEAIKDALAFVEKEAEKYDSLEFIYRERGNTLLIEADNKGVKSKSIKEENIEKVRADNEKKYLLNPLECSGLLKEIGVMAEDNKIKNKMLGKFNQIDKFIESILPHLKKIKKDNVINIFDCACGKSYLSFALNYYLCDVLKIKCTITGIDTSDTVITESKRIAKSLGYKNMEFVRENLADFTSKKDVDVVVSLHACDTATDMALAFAIKNGAKHIFSAPCCHKELLGKIKLKELQDMPKYGVLNARLNDVITDYLRLLKLQQNGYKATAIEFISAKDTPKNLLIIANKDESETKNSKYDELKSKLKIYPIADYNYI